jgi:hypothetical protein
MIRKTGFAPNQKMFFHKICAYLLTYLALQPMFGLGLITKISPFHSILRLVRPDWGP